ncbi:hypothetical protein TrRE_jg8693 [Triparma retinervis]|uniref:Uncharacterized protein n=1 Tax=Triparma retinervis TaxID=2557542 RepID=A0A9W6Z9P5_9STRA|nr:hypothetical protein TrRE_jg8693 [Triparma retinervis]
MKTSFMVLHVQFLERYSCDGAMTLARNEVDNFGGVVRFSNGGTRSTVLVEPRIHRECTYKFADCLLQLDAKDVPSQHLEVKALSSTGTTVELELVAFDDSKYRGENGHHHDVEVKCIFDETENYWRVKESSKGLPPFSRESVDEETMCEAVWSVESHWDTSTLDYKWV